MFPAAMASEGVRCRQYGPEQGKRPDALKTSDTFKVSDRKKASEDNASSIGILRLLTPSDAIATGTASVPELRGQPRVSAPGVGDALRYLAEKEARGHVHVDADGSIWLLI